MALSNHDEIPLDEMSVDEANDASDGFEQDVDENDAIMKAMGFANFSSGNENPESKKRKHEFHSCARIDGEVIIGDSKSRGFSTAGVHDPGHYGTRANATPVGKRRALEQTDLPTDTGSTEVSSRDTSTVLPGSKIALNQVEDVEEKAELQDDAEDQKFDKAKAGRRPESTLKDCRDPITGKITEEGRRALRKGVKNVEGVVVYFQPSFVEDNPWKHLER